jgi:hypothetical protein
MTGARALSVAISACCTIEAAAFIDVLLESTCGCAQSIRRVA